MKNKRIKKKQKKLQEQTRLKERIEVFKNTNDEWYPNFETNKVKLSYHGLINEYRPTEQHVWRVSCWGNDDFGIDKDFKNKIDAEIMFDELNVMTIINHSDLYERGFTKF